MEWSGRGGYLGKMPSSARVLAATVVTTLSLTAVGCPRQPQSASRPAPTPRISIPAPKIKARAHPAYRLVIPPRSIDAPTRLVAVFVRVKNIDGEALLVRPDLIKLELPDGSSRTALDQPRAFEILKRSLLARYEFDGKQPSPSERRLWERKFREELITDTQLAPGESVEGFVVVDTTREFPSLDDTVVEAVAEATDPPEGEVARYPVRVILGAPIEMAP